MMQAPVGDQYRMFPEKDIKTEADQLFFIKTFSRRKIGF